MKNPWEWDENDLLELVKAGTQESIELDFKESGALQNTDKKKDEISKDVSAFANSAGGTLLYGMMEDKNTHVAIGLDTGVEPTEITKEWLEQVINSRIHRRIDGVRIQQVVLTKTSPGRVAYVVYVPSSTRAPHQASDKRFYKRFNFQSVPMEEYEMRDVSRRGEVPDLRIEFALPKTELIFNQDDTFSVPFPLNANITNDALEPALYVIVEIYIDTRLAIQSAQGFFVTRGSEIVLGSKRHPINKLHTNLSVPHTMPIFDTLFLITDQPIMLRSPSNGRLGNQKYYLLSYRILSPRMTVKQSYAFLRVHSGYVSFSHVHMTLEEVIANYHLLEK